MKKLIFLIAMLCALSISAFASQTVYVSGFGDDANPGTEELPLKTLEAGFHCLPSGGTIVVTTATSFDEMYEFPEVDGLITVTSADSDTDYRALNGAKLLFGSNIKLGGATKFENIELVACAKDIVIICNGHYACFGEGIHSSTSSSDINYLGITGGGTGRYSANGSFIEIHSGDWFRVRGGRRGDTAPFYGDVNVALYGGTIHEMLWLAGDTATNGNGNLYIYGGTVKQGIRLANTTGFSGDINVYIHGGSFEAPINISNGGSVSGNVNINVFKNVGAKIILKNNSISGEIRVNLANASFADAGSVDSYILTGEKATALSAEGEAMLDAAKSKVLKTKWTEALHMRDMTFTENITQTSVAPIDYDTDNDGRITVKDALFSISKANDTDGDGRVTVSDAAAVLKNAITREAKAEIPLGEIKLYGAKTADGKITEGYAFADAKKQNYTLFSDVTLNGNGIIGLFFGCNEANPKALSGYYFEVSLEKEKLDAYSVRNGSYRYLGTKPLDLLSSKARIRVEYVDGAAELYFDDNPLELKQFFDFNFKLEPCGSIVGMYAKNCSATLMRCYDVQSISEKTYQNAIISNFSDPDVFYEDGIYYIYGSQTNGGITLYTTKDFSNMTYEGFVLKQGDAFGVGNGFRAANVVKFDGVYYMFYLAHSEALGRDVTAYAASLSPKGPFKNDTMLPLTNESDIIGGQPFVDDDGTVYLIYTRTSGGNQTYGAKVILKDGEAALDLESEEFLLGVTEDWEAARASVLECGFIVKHNGIYYLIYSGGNYNSTYGVGYATSKNPLGPYTKHECNPIMFGTAQSYGVGAASVFPSADQSEYFIIYLRSFSYSDTFPLQSGIDRFRFVKDPRGGANIIEICGPSVTPQPLPSALYTTSATDWQSVRYHP